MRDGQPVEPIESGRVPAGLDPELYAVRKLFHSGISVYAPEAFAVGSKFRLEVRDAARAGKSIGIDLPARTIDRSRADLRDYLKR